MEASSSQSPTQPLAPQPKQSEQQQSSSKNLKSWFDEFKAKVSKKSQSNTSSAGEQSITLQSCEDDLLRVSKGTHAHDSSKLKSHGLRQRGTNKIPVLDSHIFEASSVNSSNRRDSRLSAAKQSHAKKVLSKLCAPIKWVVFHIAPFNYDLPWKLMCFVTSSFVIVVVGLACGSSGSSHAFNFVYGFVCGLVVALACFMILTLSFVVHILPSTDKRCQKRHLTEEIPAYATYQKETRELAKRGLDIILTGEQGSGEILEQKSDDFSLFEILDQENDSSTTTHNDNQLSRTQLENNNYRGWMIEFIGDYELRNVSDIKLRSVFVRIENMVLYLCKTKNSYDTDSSVAPVITSQRVYDLANVEKFSVSLLIPKSVRNRQKYVWSKKYPIKLDFQSHEYIDGKSTTDESQKHTQLTLFSRSCREKEEWFRKFKRIVEDNRLGRVRPRIPMKTATEESLDNEKENDSLLSSFRRIRCRSPSPKRDQVQTSQSSHFLIGLKKQIDDERDSSSDFGDISTPSLIRTKSCELIHADQNINLEVDKDQTEKGNAVPIPDVADDATLTKETADIFSQAIEHTNFLENQPTLGYSRYIEQLIESSRGAEKTSDWFNALTGRIFFDVFSQHYWSVWFKRKIQRKLYRIRLPYFMETLTLTKIDLGTSPPQFLNVVGHSFDSLGLAIDFDMSYSGGLTMTFETKLNLLKIKTENSSNLSTGSNFSASSNSTTSGQLQSDLNSPKARTSTSDSSIDNADREKRSFSSNSTGTSGESSDSGSESDSSSDSSISDADLNEISDWEDYGAEKTRQSIVKFVDKIASSRYFQHARENRYIKKKLQDISNCPLILVVQIQSLNGVLTVNVPPPQTDRIWYGFKPTPELILKALPKMGDREVNLSHVTDWIERKLSDEFRKILVMPNMEDIVLPVLKSDHLQYVNTTK